MKQELKAPVYVDSEERPGDGTHRTLDDAAGTIDVLVERVIVGDERPWDTPMEPFDLKLSGPFREDEKAPNHVVE